MGAEINVKVNVTLTLRSASGHLKEIRHAHNVATTAGLADLATKLALNIPSGAFMRFLAFGSGGAEAFKTDTTLESELSSPRLAGSLSASDNKYINDVTFPTGNGTGTVREVALFDALTVGTMFARLSDFSPFVKGASDTLQVKWEITFI